MVGPPLFLDFTNGRCETTSRLNDRRGPLRGRDGLRLQQWRELPGWFHRSGQHDPRTTRPDPARTRPDPVRTGTNPDEPGTNATRTQHDPMATSARFHRRPWMASPGGFERPGPGWIPWVSADGRKMNSAHLGTAVLLWIFKDASGRRHGPRPGICPAEGRSAFVRSGSRSTTAVGHLWASAHPGSSGLDVRGSRP